MAPAWRNSIDQTITTDQGLSLLQSLPVAVHQTLTTVWHQHYEELYEISSERPVLLRDALGNIFTSFCGGNETLTHLRYVWMALTFSVVVEPTINYYQPNNLIPDKTINHLTAWVLKTATQLFHPASQTNRVSEDQGNAFAGYSWLNLSTEEALPSFQVLTEALDIYKNAIKTLQPSHSLEALLDILENCLEGYAILPGSSGRRDLLDWWLLDIVPSSWYLLPPRSIDPVGNLTSKPKSEIRLHQLEETSSALWAVILSTSPDQRDDELRTFRNALGSLADEDELRNKNSANLHRFA